MDDKIKSATDNAKEEKHSPFEFTEQEYYEIVDLIMKGDQRGYDLLLVRAEKNLKKYIESGCAKAGYPASADEVMQNTRIRIFAYFVSGYVRAKGDDVINPDYRGLSAWMRVIAINAVNDELKKNNKYYKMFDWSYFDTENSGDEESDTPKREIADTAPGPEVEVIERITNIETLKECIDVVLGSRNAVYKVLVWLGHRLIVYKYGLSDKEANKVIIRKFRNDSFNEIYEFILRESEGIEWLQLTAEQRAKIVAALGKEVEGKTMGEYNLKDLFMVTGEEKTISDWRNRLDNLLRNTDGLRDGAEDEEDEEETK